MAEPDPYYPRQDGERIHSTEWNDIQVRARTELTTHRHSSPARALPGGSLPSASELRAHRLETTDLHVGGTRVDTLFIAEELARDAQATARVAALSRTSSSVIEGDLQIDGDLEIEGQLRVDGDLTVEGSLKTPRIEEAAASASVRVLRQTRSMALPTYGMDATLGDSNIWTTIPGLELSLKLAKAHIVLVSVMLPSGALGLPGGTEASWTEAALMLGAPAEERLLAEVMSSDDRGSGGLPFPTLTHAVRLPAGDHLLRSAFRGSRFQFSGAIMHVMLFPAAEKGAGT